MKLVDEQVSGCVRGAFLRWLAPVLLVSMPEELSELRTARRRATLGGSAYELANNQDTAINQVPQGARSW